MSPSIKRLGAATVVLGALALLVPPPSLGQEAHEQRYVQALELFNSAQMEEACVLFQQIEKEKPNFKQTRSYLSLACGETQRMYELEEKLFTEGEQLFHQGRHDDARQKWEEASRLPLKNPKRRKDIANYLRRLGAAGEEPRKEQPAPAAAPRPVEPPRQNAREAARQLLGEAQAALGKRNYTLALEKLRAAETLDPANAEVRRLLGPVEALAREQYLRAGLRAYFEGRYAEADQQLTEYLSHKSTKRALAYFFRGAARGTRYYLSGEQDANQKQAALADFRALRTEARQFHAPEKFVSPKILALYTEATQERTR